MRAFITLALLGLAVQCFASTCDPSYECQFTHLGGDGVTYSYDFSSLCASKDYITSDTTGHEYYSNICGDAHQNCLPESWENHYEYGVTVQMWGGEPTCDPADPATMKCKHLGTGDPACCTKDCQVVGVKKPYWNIASNNNPATGGVDCTFRGESPSETDPFWCPFDPSTGAQYERKVTYHFKCNPSVEIKSINAAENATNKCHYKVYFETKYACASTPGLSGGWIFVIILLVGITAILIAGVVYRYHKEGIWGAPFPKFFEDFWALVKDGAAFTLSGFGHRGTSGERYDEIAPSRDATRGGYSGYQSGGAGGSSTASADTSAKSSSSYADL
jgi:hypothetical protein